MKSILAITAVLWATASAAQAQESGSVMASAHGLPTSLSDWSDRSNEFSGPDAQEGRPVDHGDRATFSLGPVAGYIKTRDADSGTWFGGIQARLHFLRILAVEGSITFHRDEFEDGDIEVTQYPVQVTGLIFPFPDSPIRPYGLAGAGWYYTKYEYEGIYSVFEDETDRLFGVHVGAGVEIDLGRSAAIFGDFRWIFLDEPSVDNSQVEDEEFDAGQVTLGLSLKF